MVARNDPQPMHHDGGRIEQTLKIDHPRVCIDTEVAIRCLERVQHLAVIPGVLVDSPYALHVLTDGVVLGDVDAVRDLLKYGRIVIDVQNGDVDAYAVGAWPVQAAVGRVHLEAVG